MASSFASYSARSAVVRAAALRGAGRNLAKPARRSSPLGQRPLPSSTPRPPLLARSPVELSCCVESLLPMHSANSSALMTSMLSLSLRGYGRLSEAGNNDV